MLSLALASYSTVLTELAEAVEAVFDFRVGGSLDQIGIKGLSQFSLSRSWTDSGNSKTSLSVNCLTVTECNVAARANTDNIILIYFNLHH